jgi:DNA-binding transcriptional LysR family regulator
MNCALTFGSYPLVLEAARQGLGIALAWRHLIEEDSSSNGTLVRPRTAEGPTRFGYYLAWQRARPPSSHALQFIDWVTAQFG